MATCTMPSGLQRAHSHRPAARGQSARSGRTGGECPAASEVQTPPLCFVDSVSFVRPCLRFLSLLGHPVRASASWVWYWERRLIGCSFYPLAPTPPRCTLFGMKLHPGIPAQIFSFFFYIWRLGRFWSLSWTYLSRFGFPYYGGV